MNTSYKYKRRSETKQRKRSRVRTIVTILQVLILLGLSVSVGTGLGLFASLSRMLPNLGDFKPPEATIIYSSDGVILGRIYREDRTNVPLKDIPPTLRQATVAIEDSRFYQHVGVDFRGVARAVWANLRGGRMAQGGSTITQQLARNVYLSQRKTFQRKVEEAMLALMIERNFTKDKILELYLNQVYYGSGAFGVQAASKVYFGKDVDQLDLAESALVAGLPQKPSGYSPHEDLKAAIGRRDVVLDRMAELGYITTSERDQAKAEQPHIVARKTGRNVYKAPHFVDWITQLLRQRGYGDDVIYAGGLRVWTSLSYEMQKIAEKALKDNIRQYRRSHRVTEGCFIAIEPATGFVRAMVGSVNPASQYNRCTQSLRQPGSSFKAFVYTAAIQNGMTPDTVIHIKGGGRPSWPNGTGEMWVPKNYDGRYPSSLTVIKAVENSVNTAAICVADEVGIKNVIKYAHLMGISTEVAPYLPSAIGASAVHPIEMASAYGTFANNGVHVNMCPIVRVTDSHGETIEDCQPDATRVMPEKSNKMMDQIFRGVVTSGTGRGVRDVRDARGKTGTTNDGRDAWFIGYVPNKLVAACWVGNDDNTPMNNASGFVLCEPVWRNFMQKSVPIYDKIQRELRAQAAGKKPEKPRIARVEARPESHSSNNSNDQNADVSQDENSDTVSVRICDDSQLLATANCPATHTERFVRGAEPTVYCTVHSSDNAAAPSQDNNPDSRDNTDNNPPANTTMVTVTVCSESGMLATPNCPNRIRKRVPVDQVPSQVCTIHGRSGGRE